MATDSWAQAVDEQEAAAESVSVGLNLKHNNYRKLNNWIKHFTNHNNSLSHLTVLKRLWPQNFKVVVSQERYVACWV